jgi:hypothetical protein
MFQGETFEGLGLEIHNYLPIRTLERFCPIDRRL